MPVSVIVGAQCGCEGKGKVSREIARLRKADVVLRVGGLVTEHEAVLASGDVWHLRLIPAGAVEGDSAIAFSRGAPIDPDILADEIEMLDLDPSRIRIDPSALVITEAHRRWEREMGNVHRTGEPNAGVAASYLAAVARSASGFPLRPTFAYQDERLRPFLRGDVDHFLYDALGRGERVVVEGSGGFQRSLLDGGRWPRCDHRSTSAAASLAEADLSPNHVDEVVLVASVRHEDRADGDMDVPELRRAMASACPAIVVLNHLDILGHEDDLRYPSSRVSMAVAAVEEARGSPVDWFGFGPDRIVTDPIREPRRG